MNLKNINGSALLDNKDLPLHFSKVTLKYWTTTVMSSIYCMITLHAQHSSCKFQSRCNFCRLQPAASQQPASFPSSILVQNHQEFFVLKTRKFTKLFIKFMLVLVWTNMRREIYNNFPGLFQDIQYARKKRQFKNSQDLENGPIKSKDVPDIEGLKYHRYHKLSTKKTILYQCNPQGYCKC